MVGLKVAIFFRIVPIINFEQLKLLKNLVEKNDC